MKNYPINQEKAELKLIKVKIELIGRFIIIEKKLKME